MSIYPLQSDTKEVLAFKAAWNLYDALVGLGVSGLTPPVYGSTYNSLLSKICYYSAMMD
jgi:hypothetical protein